MPMPVTKIAYAVYSNTDLNEGRGGEIRIAICESRTTAVRLSLHRGVQGTDAIIREIEALHSHDSWYFLPTNLFEIIIPSCQDIENDKKEAKNLAYTLAVKKALSLGLSSAELKILKGGEEYDRD